MTTHEPKILIENREELLYLLAEAAAIEHNLMCCYLYAAWSLKRGVEDGLSAEEAIAVKGWKAAITSIATEEMAHLTLACNLAVAIGGSPHLSRPNFPIPPGYHPSGVIVGLAPFSHAVLDHFIFLERPEGEELPDSEEFAHTANYVRRQARGRLMPSAQDYLTVGHLYRGIRRGLGNLHHHLGDRALFCGDPAAQLGPDDVPLRGVMQVTDIRTADRAIDQIIEQGEGATDHRDDSHYNRFLTVRREFEALSAKNPNFRPVFPVARNPVMRTPLDPHDRVMIDDPEAAPVLDLANAIYGHLLRSLAQAFGRGPADVEDKRLHIGVALELMYMLTPIAEHLASLPAGSAHPGVNAGMTFTMLRDIARLPHGPGERETSAERLRDMAAHGATLFTDAHPLARIPGTLERIAAKIAPPPAALNHAHAHPHQHEAAAQPAPSVAAPPAASPVAAAPPREQGGDEIVEGKDLTLHYSSKRCIHARFCVLWSPTVFKANTPGSWINPDGLPTDAVVAVAHNCPSGAITYVPKGGRRPEGPPPVNLINIRENGAYAVRAPIRLAGKDIGFRATLCRCGQSKNKPFCDNSHIAAGFKATGEPDTRPSEPLAVRDGVLEIDPQTNGPLVVRGNLEICAGTGRTVDRVDRARLCRCGGSSNKPFCDNTHLRIGFRSE